MPIPDLLAIDAEQVTRSIESSIRGWVGQTLRRRGAVLGLSGGIDSSVVGVLCARALGPQRVLGLLMPERATYTESVALGYQAAEVAGIRTELVPIGPLLEAAGCYRYQVEAVRRVIPQ